MRRGGVGRGDGRMPRLRMPGRIQSGKRPVSMNSACGARPMVGMVVAWGAGARLAGVLGERNQAASVRPKRRRSRARIRAAMPAARTRDSPASPRRAAWRQAIAAGWVEDGIGIHG